MNIGDKVLVYFQGEDEPVPGTLVEHTRDFKNVTIKTDLGGEMNGMAERIESVET